MKGTENLKMYGGALALRVRFPRKIIVRCAGYTRRYEEFEMCSHPTYIRFLLPPREDVQYVGAALAEDGARTLFLNGTRFG